MKKGEKKYETRFCGYCGTESKNTIKNPKGDFITTCPDCNSQIRWWEISGPTKTIDEATESFNSTELTELQRYGSKSKFRRKK